ncbi:LysR family transcriptional regulator [Vibrio sp. MACH09]|uniref:LysR family transcriptional regulator n=1 Tax=Vibrio sp. MACH09 TaxID=3025122 RepID=UPI00295E9846|nr:LysR family transcriptional regulator [Vibrio sp. MACH09]
MSITNQLTLFMDIVQQGSFSKAATLHDMDNSTLSKQIKKLEATLGVRLLNRSTRSFSLTSAGEEILQQTYTLTETLTQIQNIADSYHSTPKGTLRITSPVYFGQQYLQPVVTQFLKKHPNVQITLSMDDKKSDIIADHFDLAFRVGKLSDSNLIAKKIAKTNFAIVASQEFLDQHGCPSTPEQLIALPAVIYSNADVTLDLLRISEQPYGTQFNNHKMVGNYRVSDVRSLVESVKAGLGYSQIDLFNLDRPITELGLHALLTNYTLSTMDTGIYALYPHRKQTPLVSEFIQAVQQHIGQPAFWESYIDNYSELYIAK